MKRARLIGILLAVMVVVSGSAYASISRPALTPSRSPSEPIFSLAASPDLHVADDGEVDVFVAVMPLGMTDDGMYLDLVVVVEPQTHTREMYIVQSPLGLMTPGERVRWTLHFVGSFGWDIGSRTATTAVGMGKNIRIAYGQGDVLGSVVGAAKGTGVVYGQAVARTTQRMTLVRQGGGNIVQQSATGVFWMVDVVGTENYIKAGTGYSAEEGRTLSYEERAGELSAGLMKTGGTLLVGAQSLKAAKAAKAAGQPLKTLRLAPRDVQRLKSLARKLKGPRNPVPRRVARIIPEHVKGKTLGRPGADDVFVTAAEDIKNLNAEQIAERLAIPKSSSGYKVIEFEVPEGISTPINRTNLGFIGGGRTAGGAREFVVPNAPIPAGATIRVVR